MTVLTVLLALVLFIFLVMLIRINVIIESKGSDTSLTLKVLGIPIRLMPKKEKKKKIKLSDYSPSAMRRKKAKEEKRQKKLDLKKKKAEKEKLPEKKKEKEPLSETVSFIGELVKYLIGKFLGHLRIDMTRIKIKVGSEDAAKTALLYGMVNTAVSALLDILDSITNVKKKKKTEISVTCDFVSDKTEADIKLGFSLRIWHVFSLAFGALKRYLKKMFKSAI